MKTKILFSIGISLLVIVLGVALGSVYVPPADIINIINHKTFGLGLHESVSPSFAAIVWNLRLPRTLLAFMAGGALSVSGVVMQSVLRNPLASSYTLGVSSGASLGAGLVIFLGFTIPMAQIITLPLMGFVFGLLTILFVIAFTSRFDAQMENNTIILAGMVFSLFINAITTLMSALSRENAQRFTTWQLGSFSMKGWQAVLVLFFVTLAGTIFIMHFHLELDIMSFGEEQAGTMGVDLKKLKRMLLTVSAALTGCVVAFGGIIGFVDLVAPHIVRKLFGAQHKYTVPLSAVFGGAFMVVCDLVARTIVSPSELPVGAVTAMIGAPFFAYIYFSKRSKN